MSEWNINGGDAPTNPDLVKAMKGAAIGDNPNTRGKLYNAMLASTFIIPVSQTPNETGESTPIRLVMSSTEEGYPLMVLFTDEPSLQAWQKQEMHYVTFSGADAFAIAAQNNIAQALINPAGPEVVGELTAYELQALARGLVPGSPESVEAERMIAPKQVGIAPPTEEELPGEVALNHIRATLERHKDVAAGYLFMMNVPEQSPTLVGGIILDVSEDDADKTMRDIVSIISPALHGKHMNFMVLEGGLQQAVESVVKPLYIRLTAD